MDAYKNTPVERPGCVTAYAVLLWLTAAGYVIVAFAGGYSLSSDSAVVGIVLLLCGLIFAAVPVALGIGLWQMKKWAWALVLVVQGLGIVGGLLNMLGGFLSSETSESVGLLCGSFISMLVSGSILYWFVTNRQLFDPPQYVMGPDGNMVEKKSDNTAVIIAVAGAVVVICLVPIVIIAVLTLLGPQIGNVFSRIVTDLGTPTP